MFDEVSIGEIFVCCLVIPSGTEWSEESQVYEGRDPSLRSSPLRVTG